MCLSDLHALACCPLPARSASVGSPFSSTPWTRSTNCKISQSSTSVCFPLSSALWTWQTNCKIFPQSSISICSPSTFVVWTQLMNCITFPQSSISVFSPPTSALWTWLMNSKTFPQWPISVRFPVSAALWTWLTVKHSHSYQYSFSINFSPWTWLTNFKTFTLIKICQVLCSLQHFEHNWWTAKHPQSPTFVCSSSMLVLWTRLTKCYVDEYSYTIWTAEQCTHTQCTTMTCWAEKPVAECKSLSILFTWQNATYSQAINNDDLLSENICLYY